MTIPLGSIPKVFTGGDTSELSSSPGSPDPTNLRGDFDAVAALYQYFPWLRQLEGIGDLLISFVEQDMPPEAIAAGIRDTDVYRQRFTGMESRRAKGLSAISEAAYLDLEESYRTLLRDYGVGGSLAPDIQSLRDFASGLIGEDISASELSRRLDAGYAQVVDSGEFVGAAFEQFYGIRPTEEQLLLYALDPDRGLKEIENAVEVSLIGGEAFRYGLNINRTRAEMLKQSGVSREMARTGFADVARETPQLKTLAEIHNRSPLSQMDLENLVFHEDPNVAKERFRIFETALNEFSGQGRAATTQSGGLLELVDRDRSV